MSVPTAPLIFIRPRATDQALTFTWQPPSSDGGSAITGYELTCTGVTTSYPAASDRTYTVSGLTNNTEYTFSIAAVNGNGTGATATFRTVRPGNKPSAARTPASALTDVSSNAVVNWTFPTSTGGADIGWYVVKALYDGSTTTASKVNTYGYLSTIQVPSIDLKYNPTSFQIYAVNDPGYAPVAATNQVGGFTWSNRTAAAGTRNWVSMTSTGKGDFLGACVYGGAIYKSTDFGNTWTALSNGVSTSANWVTVAMSGSGTYWVACITGGYIYVSNDAGASFTEITYGGGGGPTWNSSALNGSGESMILGTDGQYIWTSGDSGVNWTERTSGPTGVWSGVAIGANDGTKMAACDYGTGSGGSIWTSADGGGTWTERTAAGTRQWKGICMSSDGTRLAASTADGSIWTSADSGATWTERASAGSSWNGICCSSTDGLRISAQRADGYIFTSADGGATWTNQVTIAQVTSIACNANGKRVASCGYGGSIYTGMLTRDAWVAQGGSGGNNWVGAAISADGTKMASCDSGGYIYTSSDAGVTWTQRTSGLTPQSWGMIKMSADGTKLVATAYTDYIYTSANSGASWTQQTGSGTRQWRALACSSNGSVIIAGVYTTGAVYISTDSGVNWAEKIVGAGSITGVGCSADGTKMVVADYAGNIYLSTDTGANWTTASGAGTHNWFDIAMSADGTHIAVTGAAHVLTSSDSGSTWTEQTGVPNNANREIAMSADGSILRVDDFGYYIYKSTDYGVTWVKEPLPYNQNWTGLACSADGKHAMAPLYQVAVWTTA